MIFLHLIVIFALLCDVTRNACLVIVDDIMYRDQYMSRLGLDSKAISGQVIEVLLEREKMREKNACLLSATLSVRPYA